MNLNLTAIEKWQLTINSVAAGFDYNYVAIVKWLDRFDTLDAAFDAAMDQRDGMVAT